MTQPTLTTDELAELARAALAEHERTSPGPWFASYSRVWAQPLMQPWEDCPPAPDDHTSQEYRDWKREFRALDPEVAVVPATYGDTPTGRHAADADFIAHAHEREPVLAQAVERLLAENVEWQEKYYGISNGAYIDAQDREAELLHEVAIAKGQLDDAQKRIAELEAK